MARRILVIEDDPGIADVVRLHLQEAGYQVEVAPDGQKGLERSQQERFDLVILDLMFPSGPDGLEVCRQLRADPLLASVPVIMVTTLADRDSRLQGFEAGADDFVSKPIDEIELLARVRTTTRLNRYRQLLLEQARRREIEEARRELETELRRELEIELGGIKIKPPMPPMPMPMSMPVVVDVPAFHGPRGPMGLAEDVIEDVIHALSAAFIILCIGLSIGMVAYMTRKGRKAAAVHQEAMPSGRLSSTSKRTSNWWSSLGRSTNFSSSTQAWMRASLTRIRTWYQRFSLKSKYCVVMFSLAS